MYTAFYADSGNRYCKSSNNSLEDTVFKTMKEKEAVQDRLVYMINIYRSLKDCADDFNSCAVKKKSLFWRTNKYLLNFVNTAYSFKEYVEYCYGKESGAYKIVDRYYMDAKWFYFICNYRNRVVHQSALIKDYDMNSGDLYIDLEELIEGTKEQIEKNPKTKENAKKFICFIESQFPVALQQRTHHFIRAKQLLKYVMDEIHDMANELFLYLYDTELKSCWDWFLSMTLQNEDAQYLSTYIVHDEADDSFQPNIYLEEYAVIIMFTLGKCFDATNRIIDYFKDKKYEYFFTRSCSFREVVAALEAQESIN